MMPLDLHPLHERWGAAFDTLANHEVVRHYGAVLEEYRALRESVALLDLSFRSRLSVCGTDRDRFLNGQVTNDLKRLVIGAGCYAAIVNARGKMDADANIYRLTDQFLLDLEPGMGPSLIDRLNRYIIADDVVVQVPEPRYAMLSVQGPLATKVLPESGIAVEAPARPFGIVLITHADWGPLFIANEPRVATHGYDIYVPADTAEPVAQALQSAVARLGGRPAGWDALETVRIEAGIPRFGADMDSTNLPPEAGIESRAISYSKGCYIGQEVIARIRTYGQVTRTLRGLRLPAGLEPLPARGDSLSKDGQVVGAITSATHSPSLGAPIALGYVRKECNQPGTLLTVGGPEIEAVAEIVPLPFVPSTPA